MEAGVIVMDGATNWCYWGMRVDGRMEKRQMGNGGTLERERVTCSQAEPFILCLENHLHEFQYTKTGF